MESGLIAAIALVAIGGGAVALLVRQRNPGWSFTALRSASGSAAPVNGGGVTSALPGAEGHHLPTPIRLESSPAPDEPVSARLKRIEERLDELQRSLLRQRDEAHADVVRLASELEARADADRIRQEGALERLRADVLAALPRVAERQKTRHARRPEVCAELYARLARLEAALAAVTNPVLLPGETYAPPNELPPEALVWENWNEVGERVFALAELFSAQRLHLSEQTRVDMGVFITTVRTLLTQSVYPNLRPGANPAHQTALRAALAEIAVVMAQLREMLEREYRGDELE